MVIDTALEEFEGFVSEADESVSEFFMSEI